MKYSDIILSLSIFVAFLFLGCAPVSRVNLYGNHPYAPNYNRIAVFTSPNNVPYEYKEIGLITVDDEGWGRSESELLNTALYKAREIGAQGIIILTQDKQVDGYVPVGNIPVAVNRRIFRASAIVKTGDKRSKDVEKDINIPPIDKSKTNTHNSIIDELVKLNELKEKGIITEDEFTKLKSKLIDD